MSEERHSPDMGFEEKEEKHEEKPQNGTHRRPRRPSLFWPLLLIGGGVVLLLQEFDYLEIESWTAMWRYWPLLLILGGLDLLLGRRSILGSIFGAILTLAIVMGVLALIFSLGWDQQPVINLDQIGLERQSIQHALDDYEEATVTLKLNRWQTGISALDDSSNLIEGEIEYVGNLEFDVQDQSGHAKVILDVRDTDKNGLNWFLTEDGFWEIGLSPKVLLNLDLDVGSGSGNYDLSELQLQALTVDGGSGSFSLALPAERNMDIQVDAGSGSITLALPERGTAEIEVDGSSGNIRFEVPDKIAVRIELSDGSGSLQVGDRFTLVDGESDGDGVWETENYDRAENRFVIHINQRSGSILFE